MWDVTACLPVWSLLPALAAGACAGGLAASIGARRTAERTAAGAAPSFDRDRLTGLPMRRWLAERIAAEGALATGTDTKLAVFAIDLDHFARVNALAGEATGDTVLKLVARRLQAIAGPGDAVARLGGDAFALVRPGVRDASEALGTARTIMQAVGQPFRRDDDAPTIAASVGVAILPEHGPDPHGLLRRACIALWRAKAEGPGSVRLFEPAMSVRLHDRRAIERDLGRAIAKGEIELHYQPVFDCSSGRLVGFEALARWRHPERGLILPAEFIGVAEESGQILALGERVLELACREAAAWPTPLRIAVNLSPVQFRDPGLPGLIGRVLAETGLDPARLELEITEGVLVGDGDSALLTLEALRRLGVAIALDDFGTGYASLGYLQRFPFDKLKIDRSFVQRIGHDRESRAIVRAIIALGETLSMEVTAEGVEEESQLDALRGEGCTNAQGFLLGRPTPPGSLGAIIDAGSVPTPALAA